MQVSITQAVVNTAKPKNKPFEIRDKKLIGFLVRVQPSGKSSYYCEYKRGKRINIGPTNVLQAKDAREKARQILGEYYREGDDAFKKEPQTQDILTFKEFLQKHYIPWARINHKGFETTKRYLTVECGGFLKTKIDQIKPRQVEKWRQTRLSTGVSEHSVNRCFATFKASISRAVEWELIDHHPFKNLKPLKADSNVRVRYYVCQRKRGFLMR